MDDFDYFGWVNDDSEEHASLGYRIAQFDRILDGTNWAIFEI